MQHSKGGTFLELYDAITAKNKVPNRRHFRSGLEANIRRTGQLPNQLNLSGKSDDMFNTRMDDNEVVSLCECLENNDNFHAMDISYNMIVNDGVLALASLVQAGTCNLQSLNISNNRIDTDSAVRLATVLASTTRPVRMTSLNIGYNPIGDVGAVSFCQMLKTNTTLTSLDLSHCGAKTRAIILAAEALRSNTTLKTLVLDDPVLFSKEEETLLHLGEALRVNSTLTALSLAGHQIADNALEIFTFCLKQNQSLTSLNLRRNKITIDGGIFLARLLAHDGSHLKHLDLTSNRVDDNGAEALSEALESNTTLTSLLMPNNSVHSRGIIALAMMLVRNKTLTRLHLFGNEFEPDAAANLLTAYETSTSLTDVDFLPFEVDGVARVAKLTA